MSKFVLHAHKNTGKIFFIVVIQIVLLLTSFLILEKLESDKGFLGQTISHAGKNRFLTEHVLLESVGSMNGYTVTENPLVGLTALEKNIEIIKTGGNLDDYTLKPLPYNMMQYWQPVHDQFIIYKNSVKEFYKQKTPNANDGFKKLDMQANDLVAASDILAGNLADLSDQYSKFILNLQIFFMVLNVLVQALLVLLIIHIVRSETKELQKIEKLGIIGETAARLGHDLRNPLSIIKMNVDIMRLNSKNVLQDQITTERYDVINKAVLRMVHQIEDVLDFVRTKPLDLGKHSLLEIIKEASNRIQKPENIQIHLPKNDVTLVCDAKNLEIVFVNMIINAIQAIGDKGEIGIDIIDDQNDVYVSIEDSGPGIPKDAMAKIFNPLFTTKQTGTGLGLPSCKNIIEQHNGTISVKNRPTTFTITLPKIVCVFAK